MEPKKTGTAPRRGVSGLSVCLAYLLVCTLLLTGITFSKYVTGSQAADTARVAKGLVTVDYTGPTALRVEGKPGGGFEYSFFSFDVSNENSEVAIGYDIVVTLNEPLPSGVTMTLSVDNEQPMQAHSISPDQRVYTYSNVGTFEAGKEQTKTHMLGFLVYFMNFKDEGAYDYGINISIESHQID